MDTSHGVRADLFDPTSLVALGHIELIARWVVEGFIAGLHRSPRKGFSVEFAEYRPYLPGDDLRYLDWKIQARSDRWMIKQYEEETNLRATVVLDVSRSMAWSGSSQRLTKLAYAEQLVAALTLLLIRQRDAVGLVRFDETVRTVIRPRARSVQWRRILLSLGEEGRGLASRAPDALVRAAKLIRRAGMVVLISDLLMDAPEVESAVKMLRAGGHDVTVLHIMDPAERDFTMSGEALFVDPESRLEVPASATDVRGAYKSTVLEAIAEWRAMFASVGVGYEVVYTDQPFGIPLRLAFARRQRRV